MPDDRIAQANKILADPSAFKYCEACGSISTHRARRCVVCHGYNFIEDAERVKQQAQAIITRAPTTVQIKDLE